MSDPFFDDVVTLIHADDADGSTAPIDVTGVVWTQVGTPEVTHDQSKFGVGSLALPGGANYWESPVGTYNFGTGDFTVEGWHRVAIAQTGNKQFMDFRVGAGDSMVLWNSQTGNTSQLGYSTEIGTNFVASGVNWALDTWEHWAVTRKDGVIYGWQNGTLRFTKADARSYAANGLRIGSDASGLGMVGWQDDIRVTEGVARYIGTVVGVDTYTIPTAAFPDSGPVIAPTIDTQPQPQTVTEGNNAVYTVAATTSGGTLLYQWYETTAGLLGGETADTLTITTVLGDNGNGYYVTVTDDNDTVTSDTAALTVNAVGTISTLFDDSKGFPSEEYENAIDRITFMMQELEGSLCDCRYIDPETGLPPVVTCVPLLSSTGIYNTELQGGGEATPIEGETLTLGVSVSGTGPYTYQWKVDAVDVVGATSLTFDYVVTAANVSITVQVTNACSTILVGPYLVEFCEGYDCDALWIAGQIATAYWPMTDPMVPAGGASRYFHAGETYGPYSDGGGGLGLYRLSGDVHPVIVQNVATIAVTDFNYCGDEVVGTYDHWIDTNLSNFGHELRQGGVTVRPDFSFFGSASHILVGNAHFTDFYTQGRFSFVFDEGDPQERDNDSTQMWTRVNMGGSDVTVSLQRGSGTSPSTTVAHDIDTTKPYVVTTTLGNTWVAGDNPTSTANSSTSISQPGATTVVISLVNIQTYGEINVRAIINGVSGSASINLGVSGGSVSWLGISFGGSAQLLDEGLARNYEDYECP